MNELCLCAPPSQLSVNRNLPQDNNTVSFNIVKILQFLVHTYTDKPRCWLLLAVRT